MLTPSFEFACYVLIVCLILWLRHGQAVPASESVPAPEPQPIYPVPATPAPAPAVKELPRNAIAALAMQGVYTTKVSYSAWGEFEPGWNLGSNGKPLSGAALAARRRKLERERSQ